MTFIIIDITHARIGIRMVAYKIRMVAYKICCCFLFSTAKWKGEIIDIQNKR